MRGRAAITLALAETRDDPVKAFDVFVNDVKVSADAKRQGGDVLRCPARPGHPTAFVGARRTTICWAKLDRDYPYGEGA